MTRWNAVSRVRHGSTAIRGYYCSRRTHRLITINYRTSGTIHKEDNHLSEENEHAAAAAADPAEHTQSPRISSSSTIAKKSASPLPLHNSLSSFLTYASQTNMSPTSTVFRGTKYEYTCLEALSSLGFKLTRVGGANDAGIDLQGSWLLPTLPAPLKALVQCKFLGRKSVSPVLVRELEGAFSASPDMDGQTVVGLLCTPGLGTKAVREALRRSARPVVLVSIDEGGWIEAVVWNEAVRDICEGVSVGVRHVGKRKAAFLVVGDRPWEADIDNGDRKDN